MLIQSDCYISLSNVAKKFHVTPLLRWESKINAVKLVEIEFLKNCQKFCGQCWKRCKIQLHAPKLLSSRDSSIKTIKFNGSAWDSPLFFHSIENCVSQPF